MTTPEPEVKEWSIFFSFMVFLAPTFTVSFLGACLGIVINTMLLVWSFSTLAGPDSKYKDLAEYSLAGCIFAIPITVISIFALGLPLGLMVLIDIYNFLRSR